MICYEMHPEKTQIPQSSYFSNFLGVLPFFSYFLLFFGCKIDYCNFYIQCSVIFIISQEWLSSEFAKKLRLSIRKILKNQSSVRKFTQNKKYHVLQLTVFAKSKSLIHRKNCQFHASAEKKLKLCQKVTNKAWILSKDC